MTQIEKDMAQWAKINEKIKASIANERKVLFQCCDCGEPIRDGDIYYTFNVDPLKVAICKRCCKFNIAHDDSHVNFSDIADDF